MCRMWAEFLSVFEPTVISEYELPLQSQSKSYERVITAGKTWQKIYSLKSPNKKRHCDFFFKGKSAKTKMNVFVVVFSLDIAHMLTYAPFQWQQQTSFWRTVIFRVLLTAAQRGLSIYPLPHLNPGWRTLPWRGVRAFLELATRHASHSNGGSRFELELDRRNAARGNAGSRVPSSIQGAQVGVSSDYHKTQPASN